MARLKREYVIRYLPNWDSQREFRIKQSPELGKRICLAGEMLVGSRQSIRPCGDDLVPRVAKLIMQPIEEQHTTSDGIVVSVSIIGLVHPVLAIGTQPQISGNKVFRFVAGHQCVSKNSGKSFAITAVALPAVSQSGAEYFDHLTQ